MKNKSILIILFALFLNHSISGQGYDDFYYGFDQKIYLHIVPDNYVLEFPDGVNEDLFTQNNLQHEKLGSEVYSVASDLATIQGIFGQSYYISPVYKTDDGGEIYITREIAVKFKENVAQSDKDGLITSYG